MKKRVFALVTILFLLMPALVAHADVVIEVENDFYKQHQSQIVYLGRSFAANGADGSVPVKKAPAAGNDIAKLQNGEVVNIQYSCLYGGDFWGFTFEYSGWIKLDQMLVLYDYVAFEEEHSEELYSYSGTFTQIKETRAAVAWAWPGSGNPLWTYEDFNTENLRVSYTYRDNEGREWGFITYLNGGRNIWICLSEPLNRDMPAFNPAPEPMPWVSDTVHTDIEKTGASPIVLIVVLIAALVIGTAVLIKVFWKPNKINTGGNADE